MTRSFLVALFACIFCQLPACQIVQNERNLNVTYLLFMNILRRDFGTFYVMKDVKSHT